MHDRAEQHDSIAWIAAAAESLIWTSNRNWHVANSLSTAFLAQYTPPATVVHATNVSGQTSIKHMSVSVNVVDDSAGR